MNKQQAQAQYDTAEQARRNQKQAQEQSEQNCWREKDPAKRKALFVAHRELCEAGGAIWNAAQVAERALYNATE